MITLTTGPMFSGKTEKCLSTINRIKNMKDNEYILVVNSLIKDLDTHHSSRVGVKEKKISTKELVPLHRYCLLNKVNKVFVDESQFFNAEDVKKFISLCNTSGIDIYFYGLNFDFKMNEWDTIRTIYRLCDLFEEIRGICTMCSNPARYTSRITDNDDVIVPEGDAVYETRCSKHFL